MDFSQLAYNDTDITQGGGIAMVATSLILIFWMWRNIKNMK
jgi:hypothetical protein